MSRGRVAWLWAVLVLLAAPAPGQETRGAELLAPFKQDLQAALRAGLAEGPAEAVRACRLQAPALAAAHSKEGVRVGRSSHRLRNPANRPPAWVAPILQAWAADPETSAARTVELPEGRRGYVEPIRMQALCATCHGEQLAPGVSTLLQALYPEDRATGFRVGELRGVFWAEYPEAP